MSKTLEGLSTRTYIKNYAVNHMTKMKEKE